MDSATKKWVFNRSDEIAVENGCRFDDERAAHVCNFIESELRLYEGEYAGQPFNLMDWQREFLSRAFGWVCWSDDWSREVRRFRKSFLFVPKKNGKSPLAAAVGLYMLCADGEQGAKCYSCARDGKQAKIVHNHAMEMIRRSPNLNSNCTINKSTGRIVYHPTTSFYEIISGDNINSQEGLNGNCCVVDEAHCIDRRLAKVLEYMGASRAEPLDFAVSTYGNDPESWGKSMNDYGKSVEKGDIIDQSFLHKAYEVGVEATDDDCCSPEMWKSCNPSFGVTIKFSEMEAACSRAKKSRSDFLSFQMYRLNKWLTSANPWLRQAEWDAGKEDYNDKDLLGKECWLGLDLSKTRDMSSLVAVFRRENFDSPDEPDFLILPWFWIPRKYADDNSTRASFLEWEDAGELEIIEGEVIRQAYIRERMSWVNQNFKVQSIAYDPTFASDIINDHCEGELGWEPVIFQQSTSSFAGPTENFEALLAGGRLKHPNNSLLNWQAGNVQVKMNETGKKHPVKEREGVKKIDGIVASIMALNSAYNNIGYIPQGDMYLDNGWLV